MDEGMLVADADNSSNINEETMKLAVVMVVAEVESLQLLVIEEACY